jgi:hypothetical protein
VSCVSWADIWSYFCNERCQSGRGNKKLKPEFSRINGGGSISDISICSFDFDMSSTENGMLQSRCDQMVGQWQIKSQIYIYLMWVYKTKKTWTISIDMAEGLPWIIIQQERITHCIIWIFSHQHSHIGYDLDENNDTVKLNIVFFCTSLIWSYPTAFSHRWL